MGSVGTQLQAVLRAPSPELGLPEIDVSAKCITFRFHPSLNICLVPFTDQNVLCSDPAADTSPEDLSPQLKRPCAPGAPETTPRTHSQTLLTAPPPQTAHAHNSRAHTASHLTHTHLSQASPASSLDSPATPTTALASPAAPAPTYTDHTHSPYGEQLQPLPLTTKPHRPPLSLNRSSATSGPSTPSSTSSDTPTPSPLASSSTSSPLPPPPPLLMTQPFFMPPLSSHGALTQSQPFSLRRTNHL